MPNLFDFPFVTFLLKNLYFNFIPVANRVGFLAGARCSPKRSKIVGDHDEKNVAEVLNFISLLVWFVFVGDLMLVKTYFFFLTIFFPVILNTFFTPNKTFLRIPNASFYPQQVSKTRDPRDEKTNVGGKTTCWG